jgi:hypothetical protein
MKELTHIKRFNESEENLIISDFLESPYTVGDLKKFLNGLPDNMPVHVMNDNEKGADCLKPNYIGVINSKNLDLKSPITGEDYNCCLIAVDKSRDEA